MYRSTSRARNLQYPNCGSRITVAHSPPWRIPLNACLVYYIMQVPVISWITVVVNIQGLDSFDERGQIYLRSSESTRQCHDLAYAVPNTHLSCDQRGLSLGGNHIIPELNGINPPVQRAKTTSHISPL